MSLESAMLLFLVLAYGAGAAATGGAMLSGDLGIGLAVCLVGAAVLRGIQVVTMNSLKAFFYASIEMEANSLRYDHADKALTLLAKGKHEELKEFLIGECSDADENVRKVKLEIDE